MRLPLPTVVVGDTVFDVTDVGMETRWRTEVDTEATPTTEAEGGLDVVGTDTETEATVVVDSVVTETVRGIKGSEEEAGTGSDEAILVAVIIGGTADVEGIEAVVAEETTLVFTNGVTTCGEVVRTKTAATGA